LAEGETRVFVVTQSLMDSKDAMTMSTIVDATIETTDLDTAPPAVTREHITTLKTGIQRSEEFEKKGLAGYAANVGTKCGHDCTYCSTGTMLRMHPSFKQAGEKPFDLGYAIVDPSMPDRVAYDARTIRPEDRGLVQLCTTTDAWSPEAQEYDLGRKCLEPILGQPGWSVRILTKNAAVTKDYDLVTQHRDRVLVGLSLTAPSSKVDIMKVVEPYASTIPERIAAMKEAHKLGLRTYAMLCPLLPGIADDLESIEELVQIGLDIGAEEFFAEPVNPRGRALIHTAGTLRQAGYNTEATAVDQVRNKIEWSAYVVRLVGNVHEAVRRHGVLGKLRFLLYPAGLTEKDAAWIRAHGQGVVWLGKE
jgi:DNA repair photolyase